MQLMLRDEKIHTSTRQEISAIQEQWEEKCLKMSKAEGMHVDLSLSKALHFVKSNYSQIYREIYQLSVIQYPDVQGTGCIFNFSLCREGMNLFQIDSTCTQALKECIRICNVAVTAHTYFKCESFFFKTKALKF